MVVLICMKKKREKRKMKSVAALLSTAGCENDTSRFVSIVQQSIVAGR